MAEKKRVPYRRRKRRVRIFSTIMSLLIHSLIIAAVLAAYLEDLYQLALPAGNQEDYIVESPPLVIKFVGPRKLEDGRTVRVDIPIDPVAVTKYIMQRSQEIDAVSIDDIDAKLAELEANVAPESVDEIVEWFDLQGFEVIPQQNGTFDYATMTFYEIHKKNYPEGEGYVIIWIDRAGLTMPTDFPPDMVTPEIIQLYDIYQRIQGNPLLAKLYKGVIVKILGEMMSRE